MKIRIDKESISDFILYAVLAVYIFFAILNASFFVQHIPGALFKLVNYTALAAMVVVEVLHLNYTRRTIFAIPVLLVLFAISYKVAGIFSNVSVIILFSYFYRRQPLETVAKVACVSSILALFLVIFSSHIGFIPNYLEANEGRIRHYIGFRYSLFPSTVMLNISSIRFFLKRNRVKLYELAVLLLANYWIFRQTDSRLTFFTAILLLLIWGVLKYYPQLMAKFRPILSIFILSYPFTFLTSLWFSFNYSQVSSFQLYLNDVMGGRLYLMHKSMGLYGFKLTGQKISWVGNGLNNFGRVTHSSYLYVDNLYMQFLQSFGLIVTLAFVVGMTVVMYKLYRQKAMYLYIIFISLAFHGLIDDLISNLHYSIFPILLGMLYIEHYRLRPRDEGVEPIRLGNAPASSSKNF